MRARASHHRGAEPYLEVDRSWLLDFARDVRVLGVVERQVDAALLVALAAFDPLIVESTRHIRKNRRLLRLANVDAQVLALQLRLGDVRLQLLVPPLAVELDAGVTEVAPGRGDLDMRAEAAPHLAKPGVPDRRSALRLHSRDILLVDAQLGGGRVQLDD